MNIFRFETTGEAREATAARPIVWRGADRHAANAELERFNTEGPHGRDKYQPGDRFYANGAPKFAPDGTMLDDKGNRSIFDDVDK